MEKAEKKIFIKRLIKNKIKIPTLILAFLSVLCSSFLLWNASRTAEQSNAMSNAVTNTIRDNIEQGETVPPIFDGTGAIRNPSSKPSSGKQEIKVNTYYLSIFVRKSAHLLGYTGLAFFITLTLLSHGLKKDISFFLGVLLGIFNAIIDETVQNFTTGRTGRVSDVMIDTCGCVMGAFFAILLIIAILTAVKLIKRFKDIRQ